MRRLLIRALELYLFFAVLGHFLERSGVTHCGCADDCWCKRPGLATFRWVFPYGHRFAHQAG
jgi:hypothetical protein